MRLFSPKKVSSAARNRGVTRLLHSTHLYRNLPHILRDGVILTARGLREKHGTKAAPFLHDPGRYERFSIGLDYLNCSLSLPNVELLYHRSQSSWKEEWVHFLLDLDLLDRADTRFCAISAASERGEHIRKGIEAFHAMFADEVSGRKRGDTDRTLPTHPQAEVLVHGAIPLRDVEGILVPSPSVRIEVERLLDSNGCRLSVTVSPHLFSWPQRLLG